jgi:PAS domain-containing protein
MAIYKSGMEARVSESEKKYRTLFENMLDGFCYLQVIPDRDGNPVDCVYLDANPVFLTVFKLSDVKGKRFFEAAQENHEAMAT